MLLGHVSMKSAKMTVDHFLNGSQIGESLKIEMLKYPGIA